MLQTESAAFYSLSGLQGSARKQHLQLPNMPFVVAMLVNLPCSHSNVHLLSLWVAAHVFAAGKPETAPQDEHVSIEVWHLIEHAACVQRCRKVWGGNAQIFADLIDATDNETVLEHNMHVRHPDGLAQGYWGQGRVTLAGDAAHPLRPASGIPAVHASVP